MQNSWPSFVKNCKNFATISTKNNEKTIYECLLACSETFDAIFVIDNGSTDETASQIYKFLRREKKQNIYVFDFSHSKNWEHLQKNKILELSQMKANEYAALPKVNFPHLWSSIPANVILNKNAKDFIIESVKKWENPEIGYSFFKTSKNDWNISVVLKQGLLIPGPDSCDFKNPCFYFQRENKTFKTKFQHTEHFQKTIGEEL